MLEALRTSKFCRYYQMGIEEDHYSIHRVFFKPDKKDNNRDILLAFIKSLYDRNSTFAKSPSLIHIDSSDKAKFPQIETKEIEIAGQSFPDILSKIKGFRFNGATFELNLPFSFQLDIGLTRLLNELTLFFKRSGGHNHCDIWIRPDFISKELPFNEKTGLYDDYSSFLNPYRKINKDLLERCLLSFWTDRGFTVQEQDKPS